MSRPATRVCRSVSSCAPRIFVMHARDEGEAGSDHLHVGATSRTRRRHEQSDEPTIEK